MNVPDPDRASDFRALTTRHVRGAIRGDRESVGWVVERFTPLVRAQVHYRLGTTLSEQIVVDDVVSQVWLATIPKLGNLNARDERYTPVLLCYLSKAARGIANNLLRAHVRRRAVEGQLAGNSSDTSRDGISQIAVDVRNAVSGAARNELAELVASCLNDLDPQSREVVILRGIEGLTNHEAAAELDERPNTVAQRYKRALLRLREALPGSVFSDLEES